jgi:hypothetical protein
MRQRLMPQCLGVNLWQNFPCHNMSEHGNVTTNGSCRWLLAGQHWHHTHGGSLQHA